MAWRGPPKPSFNCISRSLFGTIAFDIGAEAFSNVVFPEIPVQVEEKQSKTRENEAKRGEIQSVTEICRPRGDSREEEDMEIEGSDGESGDSLENRIKQFEYEEKQTELQAKRTIEGKKTVCRRLKKRGLPPVRDYREENTVLPSGPPHTEAPGMEPGEVYEGLTVRDRSRSRSPPGQRVPPLPPLAVELPKRVLSATDRISMQSTLFAALAALPTELVQSIASPPHRESTLSAVKQSEDLFAVDSDDDMFAKTPVREEDKGRELLREKLDDLDDGEGYYLPQIGEVLMDEKGERRFTVQQVLGKGVYSCVVRALECTQSLPFAIKIIRSSPVTLQSGLTELKVLTRLSELDPFNHKHTIQSFGSFRHQNHLCVVFEDMELNLREVIRKHGEGVGLSLAGVKSYTRQIVHGLLLLKQAKLLHCDLKPDNILVTKDLRKVKIADFGSVLGLGESIQTDLLVARYYRAPEIVLGAPLEFGIDMWSVACTVFELYTGSILFPGSTNGELLKLIMDVKGPIPKRIRNKGQFSPRYFDPLSFIYTVKTDPNSAERVVSVPLSDLKRRKSVALMLAGKASEEEKRDVGVFADWVEKALELEGKNRLTPEQAMKHPFLQT